MTELEKEFLKQYLICFAKTLSRRFNKTVQSVDELLILIKQKFITFDDVWDDYLVKCFGESHNSNLTNDEEDFWLSNLVAYSHENYLSLTNKKDVGSGAWIKIRTTNGYELHYAKKSTRKIRLNEEYEKHQNRVSKKLNKAKETSSLDELRDYLQDSKDVKLYDAKLRYLIDMQPIQVRIQRTKSKVEYYYPYQYEIIDNIDEYCNLYVNKLPHLDIKTIVTAQNKDAIFYLQSRGISKRNAEILAALKQSYFKFDLVGATETYNNLLKANLVVTEK